MPKQWICAMNQRPDRYNEFLRELNELRLEVARHHRDFTRISEIIERTLKNIHYMSRDKMVGVLREIRGIVG